MAVGETRISKKLMFVLVPLVILLLVASLGALACSSDEETGGESAEGSCADCHNDTTRISGKATSWGDSLHGNGTAYARAVSKDCAGCHSGGAFSARMVAGQKPNELEAGDPNPTRQDCRACHQIHTTYTEADWGLESTVAVELFAYAGTTYDGGEGNLCANCHQPRRVLPEVKDGNIEVASVHYGPHPATEAATLLGIGGAGAPAGQPSNHYSMVENTCVACHMGDDASHSFAPNVAACVTCHADAEDFDINGVQTEVQGLLDQLQAALLAKGLLEQITEEGETLIEPVVGTYPEAYAAALWNWVFIGPDDGSLGVHNPAYAKALLQWSLEAIAQ